MLCVQFSAPDDDGGETAWNILSIDSNKEYCITLHPVGNKHLKKYINEARSHERKKNPRIRW